MYRLVIAGTTHATTYPYLRTLPEHHIIEVVQACSQHVRRALELDSSRDTFQELLITPSETVISGFVGLYETVDSGRSVDWYITRNPKLGSGLPQPDEDGLAIEPALHPDGELVCVELSQKLLKHEFKTEPDYAHTLLTNPIISPTPGPAVFLGIFGVPPHVCALSLLADAGVSLVAPNVRPTSKQEDAKSGDFSPESSTHSSNAPISHELVTTPSQPPSNTRILRIVNPITQQHVLVLGFETQSAARVFLARWHGSLVPGRSFKGSATASVVADKGIYVAELESLAWHCLPQTLLPSSLPKLFTQVPVVSPPQTQDQLFAARWHFARRAFKNVMIAITRALIRTCKNDMAIQSVLPAADHCVPSCPGCLEKLDADVLAGGCSLVPASALALPSTLPPDSFVAISSRAEPINESMASSSGAIGTRVSTGHKTKASGAAGSKRTTDDEELANLARTWECSMCWVRKNGGVPREVNLGTSTRGESVLKSGSKFAQANAKLPSISAGLCDECIEQDEIEEPAASHVVPQDVDLSIRVEQQQQTSRLTALQASRWICLVCAHIACPRYRHAHALQHGLSCRHQHAMDTSNGIIWSYRKDGYCHRLASPSASLAAATAAAAAAVQASARAAYGIIRTGQERKFEEKESVSERDDEEEEKETTAMISPCDARHSQHTQHYTTDDELLASAHPTFKGDYLSPENLLDGLLATKLNSINSHYSELLERQLNDQRKKFEDNASRLAQEALEERALQTRALEEARTKIQALVGERLNVEKATRDTNQRTANLLAEAGPIRAAAELLRGYADGQLLETHRARITAAQAALAGISPPMNTVTSSREAPQLIGAEEKTQRGTVVTASATTSSIEKKDAKTDALSFSRRAAKLRNTLEDKDRRIATLKKLIDDEMKLLDKFNRISHQPSAGDAAEASSGAIQSLDSVTSPKNNATTSRSGQSMTAEEAIAAADALRALLELEDAEAHALSPGKRTKGGTGASNAHKGRKAGPRK